MALYFDGFDELLCRDEYLGIVSRVVPTWASLRRAYLDMAWGFQRFPIPFF